MTDKERPEDFDACWDVTDVDVDLVHPVFFDLYGSRESQKEHFGGEFFPAQLPDSVMEMTYLELFQIDAETSTVKGIIAIDLESLPA